MRTRIKTLAMVASAAIGLTLAAPAIPAFAIEPLDCGRQNGLLEVDWFPAPAVNGRKCFANGGGMDVEIPRVWRVSSGKYRVAVTFEGGWVRFLEYGQVETYSNWQNVTVIRVEIR